MRNKSKLVYCVLGIFCLSMFSCSTNDENIRMKKLVQEEMREEMQIGRALAAKLAQKYPLKKKVKLTRYLNMIGNNIASVSTRADIQFNIGVIQSDDVNAYSCPGGYILLTTAALKQMEDESELAFVLAHEISHVTLKHGVKLKKKSGIIEFIATFLGGGGGMLNAAVEQATGELEQILLEKGRQKQLEIDADQSGIAYSAFALGYDYRSAINYLKRIELANGSEKFNKTHPPMTERLNSLSQFLKEQGIQPSEKKEAARFKRYIKLIDEPDDDGKEQKVSK